MIDYNVSDMPAAERHAIESLLGASLSADQQVFILAYTPAGAPSKAVRDAARAGMLETFAKIDEYGRTHGVSPEEANAAIDEAMQAIRPRKV